MVRGHGWGKKVSKEVCIEGRSAEGKKRKGKKISLKCVAWRREEESKVASVQNLKENRTTIFMISINFVIYSFTLMTNSKRLGTDSAGETR